ncbi:MAG: 5-formyltetrahydrofolate cyclo-ligase [Kiritimatiellia bacterium]
MKAALRMDMKRRRAGLDLVAAAAASLLIQERLCALAVFREARWVACYRALPGEVDTARLFQACFAAGKAMAVPVMRPHLRAYAWGRLGPDTAMRPGPLGIPEPSDPEWVEPDALDLIVVPGVAFDRNGGRLGHGKGYYDRLLAEAGRAFKAGLAFEWQLAECIPRESHDVAMDMVITEKQIFENDGIMQTKNGERVNTWKRSV